MNEQSTLPDEWLVRAFAASADCPTPENFLEQEYRALSKAEHQRNDRHADHCPVCATERDLARSFDSPTVDATADVDIDVDYIVARLEQGTAWLPTGRRRGRRLLRGLPVWALAAAALVVFGVLGVLRPTGPEAPGLPAFGGGEVTRGTHVDPIQPVGDLETMPGSLSWRPVSDAATYRVRLMRVDDTVLWETMAEGASVDLSATISDNLRPRVAYLWQVEALNESGTRVALSGRTRFRVIPPPAGDSDGDRRGDQRDRQGEEQP